MSIYAEMLRMALAQGPDSSDRPVGELVSEVLTSRAALVRVPRPGRSARGRPGPGSPADRIGDALAYDMALIRLCDRVEITHELVGDQAGPAARHRAEERLAERFPSIAAALEGADPGP